MSDGTDTRARGGPVEPTLGHVRKMSEQAAMVARSSQSEFRPSRRDLLGATAGAALAQVVASRPALAQSVGTAPAGAPGFPSRSSFASLKRIDAGQLSVAYAEEGPPDGLTVLLLHGWPYDIHSYVDVAPILAEAGFRVIVPYLRGYGSTTFLSPDTPRNAQQAALARDVVDLLDALQLNEAVIAGFDWGARSAGAVAALRPERCRALVSVSGYLIGSQEANRAPLPPEAELKWWYQFYFATPRGAAGYALYRRDFARLIWQLASPQWRFDEGTFQRSAAAFDNPDHVAITLHNYRWRLGLEAGDQMFDEAEQKLAAMPAISVPTITLEGDANGAPHPEPKAYAGRFTGRYEHRLIRGGIGHNLPQEAPGPFAKAVIDAANL